MKDEVTRHCEERPRAAEALAVAQAACVTHNVQGFTQLGNELQSRLAYCCR